MMIGVEEKGVVELQFRSIQARLKKQFGKTPNLDAILFLIGMQELGVIKKKFSKEQKQDLMHIAVCHLLSEEGFYTFIGRDEEGWPHFEKSEDLPKLSLEEQEYLLKRQVIRYFSSLEEEE